MSIKNLNNIYEEIKDLQNEKQSIFEIIKENEEKVFIIEQKIKKLTNLFPSCYSCGKHYHPKNMIIATQEDVDEYYDKNEGYYGPEIGEYYCGC
jgi:predicted patatin/cPLA2 family phospholipase